MARKNVVDEGEDRVSVERETLKNIIEFWAHLIHQGRAEEYWGNWEILRRARAAQTPSHDAIQHTSNTYSG
jgi:hypothetical protein